MKSRHSLSQARFAKWALVLSVSYLIMILAVSLGTSVVIGLFTLMLLVIKDLEGRVYERTQSLSRANQDLHKEITERQRIEKGLRVLAKVQFHLASSLEDEPLLGRVAEEIIPSLAEGFVIHLLGPDGRMSLFASHWKNHRPLLALPEVLLGTLEGWCHPPGLGPLRPETWKAWGLPDPERNPEISCSFHPLSCQEGVFGLLSLIRTKKQHSINDSREAEAQQLIAEVAQSIALRLENRRFLKRTQASNRAKTTFLANMSREIRTPLGSMLSDAELLLKPSSTPEMKALHATAIKQSAEQLTQLVDELHDLSNIEAGRLTLVNVDFSLHQLLKDLVLLFRPAAEDKGLRLLMSLGNNVPDWVHADPTRLRQILLNTLGNALKFTTGAEVELIVSVQYSSQGQKQIRWEIRDRGCGIDMETRSRHRHRFELGDPSLNRRYGEIGLALSKSLAKEMGGELVLDANEVEKGSIFILTVLAVEATPPFPTLPTEKPPLDDDPEALLGMRILIVEDSEEIRFMLRLLLESVGAVVEEAADGEEGVLKALQGEGYDLLIMDIQMPRLNGWEATRLLRKKGLRTPILALTAHAMFEKQRRCYEAGFDGHIAKPFECTHLIAELQQYKRPVELPLKKELLVRSAGL